MTPTDAKFGLYYRVANSKRWWLHDTYPTWGEAMAVALKLDATSTWVSEIPPPAATDTELTPAEAKRRPAEQPRLFKWMSELKGDPT
jgi:hypothetical protein